MADTEFETELDALNNYFDSDPSGISAMELKRVASLFGLSYEDARNIAKGMTHARAEVKKQVEETDGLTDPGLVAAGGGNPYHDEAGRFTTGESSGKRPSIGIPKSHDEQMIKAGFTKDSAGAWTYKHEDNQYLNPPAPATSRYGTDPAKIRRWAIREGKNVGARGRLGPEIVKEYDDTFGPGQQSLREAEQAYEKAIAGEEIGSPKRKAAFEEFRKAREAATAAEKATPAAGERNTSTPTNTDSLYGIKPGATDAERRTAYRKAAVLAVPALARFGGALDVRDASWDPANPGYSAKVAQHLVDLSKIPDHMVEEYVNAGGKVRVGNGPITKVDPDLANQSGVKPRGWPPGTSYDDVAGVFNPATGTLVLGNIDRGPGSTPVSNFAFHEFGHGLDQMRKKVSLISAEDSFAALHSEVKFAAKAAGYLNDYYVQSKTPGAGASEFFADGMRGYLKGLDGGKGDPEQRAAVMRNSFAETGTYMSAATSEKMIKYYDDRFGTAKGKSFSEPAAPVKRAYVKKKKMAVKDVTFSEEAQARNLKRSGKTYAEISDELKISVGTLSRILGGE